MKPLSRFRDIPKDIIDEIKELKQRIRNLETNNRAGYTSTETGMQVFNTGDDQKFQIYINGVKQFEVGSINGAPEVRLWRSNGLTALFLTKFAEREIIGFQDGSLHTIVGDDAITGFGLARPWLAIPFYDDLQFAPARTTTSATFVPLQYAKYIVQQPFVFVESLVRCSDGTTGGEIKLAVNGTTVTTTTTTIPVGSNTLFTQSINFAYYGLNFGDQCELTVQARRTAGAGTIGVRVQHAYGRETPL